MKYELLREMIFFIIDKYYKKNMGKCYKRLI